MQKDANLHRATVVRFEDTLDLLSTRAIRWGWKVEGSSECRKYSLDGLFIKVFPDRVISTSVDPLQKMAEWGLVRIVTSDSLC